MELTPQFAVAVLQIIWIDLLLSGDNAVVIALACRSLPARKKRAGIVLGAGVAVGLRILFAIVIAWLLQLPLLKLAGGLLLVWISVRLIMDEGADHSDVEAADSLWRAVWTIAMADAVMSLDNVVAISAASHGNVWLFTFGLLLSIPLIVMGATLIMGVLARFPILVWAGAALLGWVAGGMVSTDPWLVDHTGGEVDDYELAFSAGGALLVLLIGLLLKRRRRARLATSRP
jgi:YjbE family integral membrane protein